MTPEARRQQSIIDFLWLVEEIQKAKDEEDDEYLLELEEALCEGHC